MEKELTSSAEQRKEIVAYYDALAATYDSNRFGNSYGSFIDWQERRILDRLFRNSEEEVLDLACGSGRLMQYAQQGVDASANMLAVARRKFADKTFHLADATELPLADQSLDAIISFHFFMHLDAPTTAAVFQACHRVLKPGGRLIFDIPSRSRRRLLHFKANQWHGANSLSMKELRSNPQFELKRSYGVLFLPIHHFPKGLRKHLVKLDFLLANYFLKSYSSYLVIECVKK